ncbi:MAG TPA: S8 family serine peptidase [Anaerolineaceae bacterium]|nr:S8 family serine peptidase [Anaerolineaceae bacterium]
MQRKVLYLFTLIVLLLATTGGRSVIAQNGGKNPEKPTFPAPQKLQRQVDDASLSTWRQSGKPSPYMVELTAPPTTRVYANALSASASQADAVASARAQLQAIKAAQQQVEAALTAQAIGARVIYSAQRVINGIAVIVDPAKKDAIASIPGVKQVYPIVSKKIDNASSVPLINAHQVWQSGVGYHGENVKIGIIDTGIDYLHTDFGGDPAHYASNDTTKIDVPDFPGSKVVGGYDFVGDDYNADPYDPAYQPTPHPDPDPSDCLSDPTTVGHGTHVAGTAAGYGVNADGTTYTGAYDTSTNFNAFRVGPGVAPKAQLVALRVFGCQGSTDVVTEAIEWAVDPNGDGDPSDHLDVINMSLGSPYGSDVDPDAIASDNAAKAGVIVVTSAGNEGDTFYVNGSPGTATRAISTAASMDALDVMDGFDVNSPGAIQGTYGSSNAVAYDWANKPDATGDLLYPNTNQGGCAAFAAGTFTNKIALLDWTHVGSANECGSVTRTGHAFAAGAKGVLIAYDLPYLDLAITGSADIPSTITTKATGDLIKAQLATQTVNVTITDAHDSSVKVFTNSVIDDIASFSSRGPRRNGSALKPDITAPGMTTFSAFNHSGNQGQTLSGTSMASPHVAGVMALLRGIHPTWTVEELKALVMNTAEHDLFNGPSQTGDNYGVGRIGAGRVDALLASQFQVVAFLDAANTSDEGAVSVSFGAPEIPTSGTPPTLTKSVKLVNKSLSPVTYNLAYAPIVDMDGVTLTLSAPSITVPAKSGSTDGVVTFDVTMHFDPTLMKHPHDATLSEVQTDYRPWMSEENGYLTLTPTPVGPTPLRLQVGAFPRLKSDMHASSSNLNVNVGSGFKLLNLSGTGVDTAPGASIPDPHEELSLVSAFELAYKDDAPDATGLDQNADLRYVGVMTDYLNYAADPSQCQDNGGNPIPIDNCAEVYFGISTFGNWSTPREVEFDVTFDFNKDGTPDAVLFNYDAGSGTGNDPEDTFYTMLCNANFTGCSFESPVNIVSPLYIDTVPFNNSVMVLGVYTGDLIGKGLNPGQGFNFTVTGHNANTYALVDGNFSTPYSYDYKHPAIDTTGGFVGAPGWPDLPTDVVPVAVNLNYNAKGSPDVLLLHHHNGTGNHAEVVNVIATYLTYLPTVRR